MQWRGSIPYRFGRRVYRPPVVDSSQPAKKTSIPLLQVPWRHSRDWMLRPPTILATMGFPFRATMALAQSRCVHSSLSLPRLPVPSLRDTLERLQDTLRPFSAGDVELGQVMSAAENWAQAEGAVVQRALERRAQGTQNWLDEWWTESAYLAQRRCGQGFVFNLA